MLIIFEARKKRYVMMKKNILYSSSAFVSNRLHEAIDNCLLSNLISEELDEVKRRIALVYVSFDRVKSEVYSAFNEIIQKS